MAAPLGKNLIKYNNKYGVKMKVLNRFKFLVIVMTLIHTGLAKASSSNIVSFFIDSNTSNIPVINFLKDCCADEELDLSLILNTATGVTVENDTNKNDTLLVKFNRRTIRRKMGFESSTQAKVIKNVADELIRYNEAKDDLEEANSIRRLFNLNENSGYFNAILSETDWNWLRNGSFTGK